MRFFTTLSPMRFSWYQASMDGGTTISRSNSKEEDVSTAVNRLLVPLEYENEDASTTSLQSTITVVDDHCSDVDKLKNHPHSNNKGVRIDETLNVYHDNTTGLYQEDLKHLWSTAAEIKQFKATTIATARAISRGTTTTFNATITHNNDVNDSSTTTSSNNITNVLERITYKHMLLAAYDACCQTLTERTTSPLTPYEAQQLHMATLYTAEHIGLESLCVSEIRSDKQARRTQIVDAVMDLCCTEEDEETIRYVAQSISQAPRLYAHIMAVAQWSPLS